LIAVDSTSLKGYSHFWKNRECSDPDVAMEEVDEMPGRIPTGEFRFVSDEENVCKNKFWVLLRAM